MSMKAVRAALALGLGLVSALAGVGPATAVDSAAPVRLAIAVPLIVPDSDTGLIGSDALAQYTSPLGLLTRQLDAVIDRSVAIGIDPMILVSIRILGTSAPDSALAWLERLEAASNPTFPLAYADSDITLAIQAGSGIVLGPESFDFAIDPALFAAADETTPTPSPTPTATADPESPAAPALPTTEDLIAWPYSLTGLAWPRDNTVIAADLPSIAGSGYTTTIVASGNLVRNGASGSIAEVDGERILVSDDGVSSALRAAMHAVGDEEQQTASAALAEAIAASGRTRSSETSTVFATLDRVIPVSGSRVAEAIASLASNPAVDLVPIMQAMGEGATTATIADAPQAADRVGAVDRMLAAETSDRLFAGVAADPTAITASRRLLLLALLSNSWEYNQSGWPDASVEYLQASSDLRNSIGVVQNSNFLLIADNNQFLPITVSNELNQLVTVYITVRSESALLAISDSRVELAVEPGSQARANIPVQSLSNGIVDVEVTLTSSSGVSIGSPASAEVNVQAGWETPIVVVIAALVVAVFGFGIVRNILRRRRPVDESAAAGD